MSDTSQGPGWWLASDGKWYPPEQAPGYQRPAPVPAASGAIPRPGTLPATGRAAATGPGVPQVPGTSTGTLPPLQPPVTPSGQPAASSAGPSVGTLPPSAPPLGGYPPGTVPPGGVAPGSYPTGAYPPGAYPPGAYPPGAHYPYAGRRKTSALAIASFVLALLWIFGLGSLLAVIFGIVSLVAISHAHGALRGRGWAIAGLVIGAIGLLLTIGIGVAISRAVFAKTYPYGQTVATNDGITGFTSISVLSSPTYGLVGRSTTATVPGAFAAAPVRVCVGSAGMPAVNEHLLFFLLKVNSGGLVPSEPEVTSQSPNLWQGVGWAPDTCHTGYISFLVPPGETPDGVRYNGDIIQPIEWTPTGR